MTVQGAELKKKISKISQDQKSNYMILRKTRSVKYHLGHLVVGLK